MIRYGRRRVRDRSPAAARKTEELRYYPETGELLVDEETRERLRRFLAALVEWTQRFEDPTKASQRQAREGRA